MHSNIRNHNESPRHNPQRNDILPQRQRVEAKSAEDGGARDFDVEAVFVVDQGKVADFVDDEAFEAVVED